MDRESNTGKTYFPDDDLAASRFDDLAAELGCSESLRPQHAIMIADVVRNEKLKEQLNADIARRGLGEMVRNGRQSYWRENKSLSMLIKLADQQRRSMQALGLIAKTKDRAEGNDGDDFDDF